MSSVSDEQWKKRHKERQSRESKEVYSECTCSSCWGITLVFSFFLYTHQGYAELYNLATPEWTFFNTSIVLLMFSLSIIVTGFYVAFKRSIRRSELEDTPNVR